MRKFKLTREQEKIIISFCRIYFPKIVNSLSEGMRFTVTVNDRKIIFPSEVLPPVLPGPLRYTQVLTTKKMRTRSTRRGREI